MTKVPKELPYSLLSIDPSINSLGFAFFTTEGLLPKQIGRLQQKVVSSSNKEIPYPQRCMRMAFELGRIIHHLLEEYPSQLLLVTEIPSNWFSERGQASKDNEAIQKLYMLVGAICHLGVALKGTIQGVWCVTPSEWKGQLPKDVVRNRISNWMQERGGFLSSNIDDDAMEAVGIGIHSLHLLDPTQTHTLQSAVLARSWQGTNITTTFYNRFSIESTPSAESPRE